MATYNAIMEAKALGYKSARFKADDGDVGLLVRYIGAEVSATVTVLTGDYTFKHGASAAEAVDATIDSGGDDPGVIDVSDANANTMGEVVDLINASANWEAILLDALRADASTTWIKDLSETTITKLLNAYGLKLPVDTSASLCISQAISPAAFEAELGAYGLPFEAIWRTKVSELYAVIATNTFGSGTNLIQIYQIDNYNKTEVKLFEWAGAATTVEQVTNWFRDIGLKSKIGTHFLVRMIGSAACTGTMGVVGGAYSPTGLIT